MFCVCPSLMPLDPRLYYMAILNQLACTLTLEDRDVGGIRPALRSRVAFLQFRIRSCSYPTARCWPPIYFNDAETRVMRRGGTQRRGRETSIERVRCVRDLGLCVLLFVSSAHYGESVCGEVRVSVPWDIANVAARDLANVCRTSQLFVEFCPTTETGFIYFFGYLQGPKTWHEGVVIKKKTITCKYNNVKETKADFNGRFKIEWICNGGDRDWPVLPLVACFRNLKWKVRGSATVRDTFMTMVRAGWHVWRLFDEWFWLEILRKRASLDTLLSRSRWGRFSVTFINETLDPRWWLDIMKRAPRFWTDSIG